MNRTHTSFLKEKPVTVLILLGVMFSFALLLSFNLPVNRHQGAAVFLTIFFLCLVVITGSSVQKYTKALTRKIEHLSFDNQWKSMMIDSTDELYVVLNMYGQVVTYNAAFENIFCLNDKNILGKPFRTILFPELETGVTNLNYILLEKLRSVFLGNETELLFPAAGHSKEIKNISFKMIPVYREGELRNILVNGHIMQRDLITSDYLVTENSYHIMDNDVGMLYQLSYRLTRNLGKWFSKGDLHLIQIALYEILINAVEHGNLEIDFARKTSLKRSGQNYWDTVKRECNQDFMKNRKIYVEYLLDLEKVTYIIRDDGKGFNWKTHINRAPESIRNQINDEYHGLGLYMVTKVFDIKFDEKGNTVTLCKYFTEKD